MGATRRLLSFAERVCRGAEGCCSGAWAGFVGKWKVEEEICLKSLFGPGRNIDYDGLSIGSSGSGVQKC